MKNIDEEKKKKEIYNHTATDGVSERAGERAREREAEKRKKSREREKKSNSVFTLHF